MDIFHSVAAARLIFSLGVLNALTALLLLSSCRCVIAAKIGGKLMRRPWYKRFTQHHCQLWYVFWPSVAIHAFLAIMFLGVPF